MISTCAIFFKCCTSYPWWWSQRPWAELSTAQRGTSTLAPLAAPLRALRVRADRGGTLQHDDLVRSQWDDIPDRKGPVTYIGLTFLRLAREYIKGFLQTSNTKFKIIYSNKTLTLCLI